jgi:two-component system cell cycle sensor histidine kinase/response regulator CckA
MRVLVVEDELLIRMLMVDTLQEAGFDVLEAASGVEACRLIDNPNHVDLVVTDLNMPEADGVVVARRARAHIPDVRVLFVSARCDLLKSLSAPRPYSYLTKPFSMEQFSVAVDDLLTSPRAPA